MYCWQCGEQVGDEDAFCACCGVEIVRPSVGAGGLESPEQEVHSLLAQANLLRLRKDLQGAILRCSEALRLCPGSASAHSLLGDVCRDEGRLRDAMEWYRLALALDPSRTVDREKLDSLIDRVYGSPGKPAGVESEPAETVKPSLARRGRRRAVGLRVGAMAFAGLLLLALLIFVCFHFRSLPPPEAAYRAEAWATYPEAIPGTAGQPPPPALAPLPESGTRTPLAGAPQRQEDLLSPQNEAVAGGPTSEQPSLPSPSGASADIGGEEQRLAELLSPVLLRAGEGVMLLDTKIDPRREELEISFSLPQEQTVEAIRKRILELALQLGKEAASQETGLQIITLRAHVQVGTAYGIRHEPSFIGEADPSRLRAMEAENLSEAQAQQWFANTWWHPLLAGSASQSSQ